VKQASTGLYARLSGRPEIAALLATDAETGTPAIEEGWPEEKLDEPLAEYFPLVAYSRPVLRPIADGVVSADMVVDALVWPDGEAGGTGRLDEIAKAITAALQNQVWYHDGVRIHATVLAEEDNPSAAADDPHQRTLYVNLLLSEE
jgi:hypothetical protein